MTPLSLLFGAKQFERGINEIPQTVDNFRKNPVGTAWEELAPLPVQALTYSPEAEAGLLKIKHWTKPDNVKKIVDSGYNTSLPAIFSYGGPGGKLIKDTQYWTNDNKRWSSYKTTNLPPKDKYDEHGYDSLMELAFKKYPYGNGYNGEDYFAKARDRFIQSNLHKVKLKSVMGDVKKNASILTIDNYPEYNKLINAEPKDDGWLPDFRKFLENLKARGSVDAVNVRRKPNEPWLKPDGKRTKNGELDWYKNITGNSGRDDYFIFNPDIVENIRPTTLKDLYE